MVPFAGIVTKDEYNVLQHRSIGHYTHEKSPVACAAALATLQYIEKHDLLERARTLGAYAVGRLSALQARHRLIGDVRGLGLMIGVELVRDTETRERACDEAERVMYAALARGLSFKLTMGNILTLTPPLVITEAGGDWALERLGEVLGAA